jgi:hypothetical protein
MRLACTVGLVLFGAAACKPKPLPITADGSLVARNAAPIVVLRAQTEPGARIVSAVGTSNMKSAYAGADGRAVLELEGWQPAWETQSYEVIAYDKDEKRRGTTNVVVRPEPGLFVAASTVFCTGPKRCKGRVEPLSTSSFEDLDPGTVVEIAGARTTAVDRRLEVPAADPFALANMAPSALLADVGGSLDVPIAIAFPGGPRFTATTTVSRKDLRHQIRRTFRGVTEGGVKLPGDDVDKEGRRGIALVLTDGIRIVGAAAKPSEIDFVAIATDKIRTGDCRLPSGALGKSGVLDASVTVYTRRSGRNVWYDLVAAPVKACPGPQKGVYFEVDEVVARLEKFLAEKN